MQRYIDDQQFSQLDKQQIEHIIQEAIKQSSLKQLNMQYKSEDSMHFMLVHFVDSNGTICRGAFQFQLSSIADDICSSLDNIQDQVIAIDTLNAMVHDKQYKSDNSFKVRYCWGSDSRCSVEDWSYQYIRIKLSQESCDKLKTALKDNQQLIQDKVEETDFGQNAAETVQIFNSMPLHQEINASIWTSQVQKALTRNMLQMDDAIQYIRDQQSVKGTQHIKVVLEFNELGQFLIVQDWEVSYGDKNIKQQISENKLLDVENRKYILDQAIYSRVEKRLSLQKDTIASMFDNAA